MSRKTEQPVITYSDVGGLSLSRLQKLYPERIHQIDIDYQKGIDFISLNKFSDQLDIAERSRASFMLKNLYECFVQRDCSEIQINPLIYTPDRKFIATNTIIRLDPDSLYRQQDLAANYIDLSQISVNERIANAHAI